MRIRFLALTVVVAVAIGCGGKAPTVSSHAASGLAGDVLQLEPDVAFHKAVVGPQDDGTFVVATTQRIDPAGESVAFEGRPVDLALSPDETVLAVKNRNEIVLIDAATREIAQKLRLPKGGASWTGVAWSRDGSKVWTTSTDGTLRSAARQADGTFDWADEFAMPAPAVGGSPAPSGFAVDEDAGVAYVALSRNNSVAVVDLTSGETETEIAVGIAPYTALLVGGKLYVTNWGGRQPVDGDTTGPTSGSRAVVDPETGVASSGTVSVIDLATRSVAAEIDVDLHPSGMAVSPDGTRLYVANANSDTVSVIETAAGTVVGRLGAKPLPELPFGSAPNALAVSPDGATLYVANGGNNAVAVIDVADETVLGLIPTGWYPGALAISRDGGTLFVANTKGIGSRAVRREHGYNTHDYMGTVTFIATPSEEELAQHTLTAAANMRLPSMLRAMDPTAAPARVVPVPTRPGETSVFRHVIYIIKENRTYDQVFGDMEQGDGDPSLCTFPREVTPNHHALAEQFVLLDNFYCNGTLSADGHQWTDEGYVTDYLEKSYGGFVRSYPYDGDDALAYASSGFIWDAVLRAGLTFRDYGEFVQAKIEPSGATWTDIYNDYLNDTSEVSIRATTELHTLEPYLCPTYVGFPGKVQDVYRAREFIRELEAFEENGELPNFTIMLLPNDHTVGAREGYPTPRAAVADNDLALGRIVEAVSKSRFWPETAIFVVQDDPQAGFDHVDGRRTVALCISPYTKRGYVDSTHYNQTSMLRTMELILGLPPMNQFDMAAIPMDVSFAETADLTPYTALPNEIALDEMNPPVSSLSGPARRFAELSMELPLDDIDEADEDTLNRIIWHATMGDGVPYPAHVAGARPVR